MRLPTYNRAGEVVGETEVDDAVFGQPYNEGLVHQAYVRYNANQRVGTANTLTRGQVHGSTRKPYRQKGTGRARQGMGKAPHFRGGGVVFGPHPRDYRQGMPRKMRRQALRVALSARASEQAIRILDELSFEAPRTRDAVTVLRALSPDGKALIVTAELDRNVYLSVRNIPDAGITYVGEINIADVVNHQYLILPVAAVRALEAKLGRGSD